MPDPIWPLLCTLSLLIGWLSGRHERKSDEEILSACDWDDHVQQALYVARRWPKP